MNKTKKALCLFLSLLIMCSALPFGGTAADIDSVSKVTAMQETISQFLAISQSINMDCPKITVDETHSQYAAQVARVENYNKKVQLYSEMVAQYKALTEVEKDALEIKSALSLLKSVVEREAYLIKKDYDSRLPQTATNADKMTVVQSRIEAQKTLDEVLGPHAVRDEAYEASKLLFVQFSANVRLSARIDFNKYPQAEQVLYDFLEDYRNASPLARQYMDGISAIFESYSANSLGNTFTLIIGMLTRLEVCKNPYSEEKPQTVSKPNYKNYPGGKTDPDYLQAIAEWLPYAEASQKYSCDLYNWEAQINMESMRQLVELAPEFEEVVRTMLALREAYISFVQTGETQSAQAAMQAFDSLNAYEQACTKTSAKAYSYYFLNATKDGYSYSNLSFSTLYKKCEETGGMALVESFIAYIDAIALDSVDNTIIEETKEQYAAVPFAVRNQIPEEVMEKYRQILALYMPIQPLVPSDYDFSQEIDAFDKTQVAYPCQETEKEEVQAAVGEVSALFERIIALVLGSDLTALLQERVYTNRMMSSLLSLYDKIVDANLVTGGINVSHVLADYLAPEDVAVYLTEEQYSGARKKLAAYTSTDDYADIRFENGDWGFEDGDREGFAQAVAVMLRPVGDILTNGILVISKILDLPNTTAENGDYIYGAYEYLIPLLEALGAEGLLSSESYTAGYHAAFSEGQYAKYDALFLPILTPVLALVDKIAANPVEEGAQLLVRLGMVLEKDLLSSSLNAALHTSSLLSGVKVDFSAKAVNQMLNNLLASIMIGEKSYTFQLTEIDWSKLGHCGALVRAQSVSASNLYRTTVIAEQEDVLVLVYRYLYQNLLADDTNFAQVQQLISNHIDNSFAALALRILLQISAGFGEKTIFCALMGHSYFKYIKMLGRFLVELCFVFAELTKVMQAVGRAA